MAKTMELHFTNHLGKTVRLTLDHPKEPVDPIEVKLVMDAVIASNVFGGSYGTLVGAKEARVVERNVTEYELV
ncbi:DUF2922 domain-containing protein [Bacillus sp. V3B]|uniref:DUF2922 domain-containing protein n=1 Tax=Bacillus sp. V3B TaxID=2804915 RepID=UPI00210D1255|nr:DUF2922 domain-containing protein [Bacillus sp. V3B]MCQ6277170.1 DUF2922 domain-containing protein [Bacillus sp. V3B]